jgi:flagellar FliJ protein
VNPSQPLITLLEQAEEARDAALAQFEVSRKAHEGSRQQLQSLQDFRDQYQTRWQTQFRQAGGMEIMRCYQDFMARLGDAVNDQHRRCEQFSQAMERCRTELIERERKVAAVTQLLQRREKEQAQREMRREQKATDELAARLMASAPASPLSAKGNLPPSSH